MVGPSQQRTTPADGARPSKECGEQPPEPRRKCAKQERPQREKGRNGRRENRKQRKQYVAHRIAPIPTATATKHDRRSSNSSSTRSNATAVIAVLYAGGQALSCCSTRLATAMWTSSARCTTMRPTMAGTCPRTILHGLRARNHSVRAGPSTCTVEVTVDCNSVFGQILVDNDWARTMDSVRRDRSQSLQVIRFCAGCGRRWRQKAAIAFRVSNCATSSVVELRMSVASEEEAD